MQRVVKSIARQLKEVCKLLFLSRPVMDISSFIGFFTTGLKALTEEKLHQLDFAYWSSKQFSVELLSKR